MKKLVLILLTFTMFSSVLYAGSFSNGDSVTVWFGSNNQYQCSAVIITAGSEESKVEYTSHCKLRFLDSREAGQQEWAPNSAITSR